MSQQEQHGGERYATVWIGCQHNLLIEYVHAFSSASNLVHRYLIDAFIQLVEIDPLHHSPGWFHRITWLDRTILFDGTDGEVAIIDSHLKDTGEFLFTVSQSPVRSHVRRTPSNRGNCCFEINPVPFGSNSAQACLNRRSSSRLMMDIPLLC